MSVNNNHNFEFYTFGAVSVVVGAAFIIGGALGHNWKFSLGGVGGLVVGGALLCVPTFIEKTSKLPKPRNKAAAFSQKAWVRDKGHEGLYVSGKRPTINMYSLLVDSHKTATMDGRVVAQRRAAVNDGRSLEEQDQEL